MILNFFFRIVLLVLFQVLKCCSVFRYGSFESIGDKEEVGVEVSRANRGRGGLRPPTASYRKEKKQEKVDLKGKGKIGGGSAKKLELRDVDRDVSTTLGLARPRHSRPRKNRLKI
ncbi:hypothetical protein Syun_002034 [Stephania yunnanensis]|uniref:Uncharacterized protein n=1 Tax=Stephania yunnanensis TaxID=152371 RepID=A0AAP0LKQ6_9MAGN